MTDSRHVLDREKRKYLPIVSLVSDVNSKRTEKSIRWRTTGTQLSAITRVRMVQDFKGLRDLYLLSSNIRKIYIRIIILNALNRNTYCKIILILADFFDLYRWKFWAKILTTPLTNDTHVFLWHRYRDRIGSINSFDNITVAHTGIARSITRHRDQDDCVWTQRRENARIQSVAAVH